MLVAAVQTIPLSVTEPHREDALISACAGSPVHPAVPGRTVISLVTPVLAVRVPVATPADRDTAEPVAVAGELTGGVAGCG